MNIVKRILTYNTLIKQVDSNKIIDMKHHFLIASSRINVKRACCKYLIAICNGCIWYANQC